MAAIGESRIPRHRASGASLLLSAVAVASLTCCSPCEAFLPLSARPTPTTTTPTTKVGRSIVDRGGGRIMSSASPDLGGGGNDDGGFDLSRREAVLQSAASAAAAAAAVVLSPAAPALADIEGVATPTISDAPPVKVDDVPPDQQRGGGTTTMYKTKSGLKYIELSEGTGPRPAYGQLVSISYKAYVKLPDVKGTPSKLEQFDSDSGFLVKHGNGRTVPGLDEGLHTMRVGGTRRLILPAKLGYVQSGLGPIPESPWGRFRLNSLLDKMVELKGGSVVFDVTMRTLMDDEADQGYYGDDSMSPEDFQTLRDNLQQAGIEARASKM